jgi:hypothetical protein
VGLFTACFFAIPLGAPVGIMLAASDFSFRMALSDPSLRGGALIQAAVALWSYIELYRALRTHSTVELRLRSRFALVFMRWVVVIMVTYFLLEVFPPSEIAMFLLVVAYVGGSIAAEVAPDKFLRSMPGGEDNLREGPEPGENPASTRATRKPAARKKS